MANRKIISQLSLCVSAPITETATALSAITGVHLQVAQPITAKTGFGTDIKKVELAIAGNDLADGSASANDNVAYNLFRKKNIVLQ